MRKSRCLLIYLIRSAFSERIRKFSSFINPNNSINYILNVTRGFNILLPEKNLLPYLFEPRENKAR